MRENRAFDVVLFGATGFTGGLTAQYLASAREPLRWALAGRSRDKLEQVLASLRDLRNPPELMLADASDQASLLQMASSTRVVITTVGPYITYGEGVVAACAELGTDYVDLTGEPEFFERSRSKYDAQAQASGARIVHACGFDSVPHDLGAYFTVKALRRRMPVGEQDTGAIEMQGIVQATGGFSGGTWHSMITVLGRKQAPPQLPMASKGRTLGWLAPRLRYRRELGVWQVPLPTIDPIIVLNSARVIDEYGPSFRYGHNLGLRWFVQIIGLALGFGAVYGLAQLEPTRNWLLKLKLPGEGPSAEARAKARFQVTFTAKSGSHRASAAVRGGDPGYGETAKMLSESALCLALDRDRLPNRHGVLTSASAMGDLLIARLQRAGITFEELS
jgi:short subunit dehydrogenase-like uncharacterized protein